MCLCLIKCSMPGGRLSDGVLCVCCRHGIGNSGFYILHDPDLSFRDVITRHMKGMKLVDKKDKQKYADWRATIKSDSTLAANAADKTSDKTAASAETNSDTHADAKAEVTEDGKESKDEKVEEGEEKMEVDGEEPKKIDGEGKLESCDQNGDEKPADLPNGETKDPEEEAEEEGKKEKEVDGKDGEEPDGEAEKEAGEAEKPAVIDAVEPAPAAAAEEEPKCNGDDAGEHVENGETPPPDQKEAPSDERECSGELVKKEGDVASEDRITADEAADGSEPTEATAKESTPTPAEDGVKVKVEKSGSASVAASKEETVLPRLPNPASSQPLMGLYQMEESISKYGHLYDPEVLQEAAMIQMLHQNYAAPIQWPSDHVLHMRLQHIVQAVETGAWPEVDYSALPADPLDPGLIGVGQPRDESRPSTSRRAAVAAAAAAAGTAGDAVAAGSSSGPGALAEPTPEPTRQPPPAPEEAERRGRKRRHGPTETDSERQKLRALLNHNLQSITRMSGKPRTDSGEPEEPPPPPPASKPHGDDIQAPPPAHQHGPRGAPAHGGMDLSFKAPAAQSARAVTPGPPHSAHHAFTAPSVHTPKGDDVLDLSAR